MASMKNIEKKTLRRFGVWSLAKVGALFGVIWGLIAGIFISIAIAVGGVADPSVVSLGSWGYASIIILPIVYGIAYLIGGAVTALFYNLIAGWIGGVEVYFKK